MVRERWRGCRRVVAAVAVLLPIVAGCKGPTSDSPPKATLETARFRASGSPPVAVASVSPSTAGCGVDQLFDGRLSHSSNPGGQLVRYAWDFDTEADSNADGDPANDVDALGAAAVHRYARMAFTRPGGVFTVGPHRAALTVTDELGATASAPVDATLSFTNFKPVANPGGPYVTTLLAGGAAAPINLVGTGSSDPNAPCDAVAEWAWDTDNDDLFGAADNNGSVLCGAKDCVGGTVSGLASPAWQLGRSYRVALRTTDAYGLVSDVGETTITVSDTVPPQVVLEAPNGGEVLRGTAEVRLRVAHPQGKPVQLEMYLNSTPVAFNGAAQVAPPANGSLLSVSRTFDTTLFANAKDAYRLRVVAKLVESAAVSTSVLSAAPFSLDNSAPMVIVPANELAPVLECASPSGTPFTFHPTASDSLDPAPRLAVAPALERYPLGQTPVVFTATDWAGNVAVKSVVVRVQDSAAPQLVPGPDLVVEAAGPAGTPVPLSPSASDACDSSVVLTSDAPPGGFPLGSSTVSFTATDDAGNRATGALTVTVLPVPVAVASASPMEQPEACPAAPLGNAVTFDHSASYHLGASGRLVDYRWLFDVGAAEPAWPDEAFWASVPDGEYSADRRAFHSSSATATPSYAFAGPGTFSAALQVVDDGSPAVFRTARVDGIVVTDLPDSDGDGEPDACECLGVTCLAQDGCHLAGTCDPATGACSNPVAEDGSGCDDGDACTAGDACAAGRCLGSEAAALCDDANPCTSDACHPATGCLHQAEPGPCDDGNACTVGDACSGGLCLGSDASASWCDDANACTDDACSPATGCVHAYREGPCDDGNACTADQCEAGACRSTAIACADADPCTQDACDPTAGCVHSLIPACCSQAHPCPADQACRAGVCEPVLCEPCGEDADCGVEGAVCSFIGNGTYCAPSCETLECAGGSACSALASGAAVCLPESGLCRCIEPTAPARCEGTDWVELDSCGRVARSEVCSRGCVAALGCCPAGTHADGEGCVGDSADAGVPAPDAPDGGAGPGRGGGGEVSGCGCSGGSGAGTPSSLFLLVLLSFLAGSASRRGSGSSRAAARARRA